MPTPHYPTRSAWRTGFRGKCPRCGEGALYSSFLKVADNCQKCGLDLSQEDAGDGAVPFIIIIAGTLGVGIGVWVMFTFETGVWTPITVAFPVVGAVVLGLLPKAKGLLIALQYLNKAGDTGTNTFDDDTPS